jgi:hypothetical protein
MWAFLAQGVASRFRTLLAGVASLNASIENCSKGELGRGASASYEYCKLRA